MATTKHDSTTPFPPREACRILILGCGNSRVGEDLLGDGWTGQIVNVDFSPVAIEQMKERYNDKFYHRFHNPRKMEFLCSDVTQPLPFEDKSFDLIICKGTFDAVLCSSGSVANANRMIEESVRLLANGHGVFFLVSYANPDSRVVFLERQNDLSYYWQEVSTHTVSRGNRTGNK
jgi:SAM-dependent methyltransferase